MWKGYEECGEGTRNVGVQDEKNFSFPSHIFHPLLTFFMPSLIFEYFNLLFFFKDYLFQFKVYVYLVILHNIIVQQSEKKNIKILKIQKNLEV